MGYMRNLNKPLRRVEYGGHTRTAAVLISMFQKRNELWFSNGLGLAGLAATLAFGFLEHFPITLGRIRQPKSSSDTHEA